MVVHERETYEPVVGRDRDQRSHRKQVHRRAHAKQRGQVHAKHTHQAPSLTHAIRIRPKAWLMQLMNSWFGDWSHRYAIEEFLT